MRSVLVIGYGNTLRGDDGAGVRAAELIAQNHPEITCIPTHQLTPELAEPIAAADIVFFLDAQADAQEVVARPVEPKIDYDQPRSHFFSPQSLLSLGNQLYNRVPAYAYVIGIPATNFKFSEHLTLTTAKAVEQSMDLIEKILTK